MEIQLCDIDEGNGPCGRKVLAKGLCGKHYQRLRNYGDPYEARSRVKPVVTVGETYGRLTILSEAGTNDKHHRLYNCVCECGTRKVVAGFELKNGNVQSCGCLHRERFNNRRHGMHGTPEYTCWQNMLQRCRAKEGERDWEHYAGKGIIVCPEWDPQKGGGFAQFYADMGPRPEDDEDVSIDREDSNGNYEPTNCRWLSLSENSRRAHLGFPHDGQGRNVH